MRHFCHKNHMANPVGKMTLNQHWNDVVSRYRLDIGFAHRFNIETTSKTWHRLDVNYTSFHHHFNIEGRHHFNIEKSSKLRHRFNIVFSTKKWHTNLNFQTWPLTFQRTCIYNQCNTFTYRKMLMQSKFSWLNLITTHFKSCAHHETTTFMLLPVVDNITFIK